jgi:quercetin dioxygenase-like cupin family protein
MTEPERSGFAHVRPVDAATLDATAADARFSQVLLGHDSGARNCTISFVRTPPGGGSPEGLHTHEVDQVFYVIEGSMSIEVAGATHEVPPGNLIVFPAGVPHRNWNGGSEPTVHIAFNTPLPDPGKPFATRVEAPDPR